jgi:integrase
MASMYRENDGWSIQFMHPDGARRTLRIGDRTKKQATALKLRVEQLVNGLLTGHPADDDTLHWVEELGDTLHVRLSGVGLVEPRQSSKLKPWLDKYMAERTDLKPESLRKLQQTVTKLVDFFGADASLRNITPEKASEWRAKMQADGLGEASLKIQAGNAKTLFAAAQRRKLVAENPFLHLASGPTAAKNDRYVTPEECALIIGACHDERFKLIFGLARYAGLRIRSEAFALTWRDVDLEACKMLVKSPKTERHKGHEQRWVPITTKLMSILQGAFEKATEGTDRVVPMTWTGFVPERMLAIVKAAAIKPWPKLFQTLRSSCEKEWAMTFPQYAVSKWIGHSITVSGRHYVNDVPEELFNRVSGRVVQNPVRQQAKVGEDSGNRREIAKSDIPPNSSEVSDLPPVSVGCTEDVECSSPSSPSWRESHVIFPLSRCSPSAPIRLPRSDATTGECRASSAPGPAAGRSLSRGPR